MGLFTDEMRLAMGFGTPSFEVGTWFCVPHDAVFRAHGKRFADKSSGGDGRRVVLAGPIGVNTRLFARSASIVSAYEHASHVHYDEASRCRIDRKGWIPFNVPIRVDAGLLCTDTYSCEEPTSTGLLAELSRRTRL